MAGRIAYGLFPGVAILLAVGTALGQGMQTFKNGTSVTNISMEGGSAKPNPARYRTLLQNFRGVDAGRRAGTFP
jgi:hypothetical protein